MVAGNDVVLAQKAVEADQGQVAAAQQNVEAARQALNSISEMEGYLRVTAPFDGIVTERNVHPGALVGPASGPGAATPMVRLVESDRLRLVVPVPEAYTAGMTVGTEMPFSVAAYPGQTFSGKVARIAQAVDVEHAHDGRGTGCDQHRRTARTWHVLSGPLARASDRAVAARAEWERREHDRSHVCGAGDETDARNGST